MKILTKMNVRYTTSSCGDSHYPRRMKLRLSSNGISYVLLTDAAHDILSHDGNPGLVTLWNVVEEGFRALHRTLKMLLDHSERRIQRVSDFHHHGLSKNVSFACQDDGIA